MPIDINKYKFLEELEDDVDYLLEEQKVAILEELITAMETRNINRAELARRLGTSRAYVTKLFRMNVNFTLRSLVQIAHAIGDKISIHLHAAEAQAIWFDLYKQPPVIIPNKSLVSKKGFKQIKHIKNIGVRYEYSAFTA